MSQKQIPDVIRQFLGVVETALGQEQEVHCTLHLGNYAEPDGTGHARSRLDGSAALLVFIDPLPPGRHPPP
jgi:hypothetical protein